VVKSITNCTIPINKIGLVIGVAFAATSCFFGEKSHTVNDYFDALGTANIDVTGVYEMDNASINSMQSVGYYINGSMCQVHEFDLNDPDSVAGKEDFFFWIEDMSDAMPHMKNALPIENNNLVVLCGKGKKETDEDILRSLEVFRGLGSSTSNNDKYLSKSSEDDAQISASKVHNEGWKLFQKGDIKGSVQKYDIAIDMGETTQDPNLYHYYNNRAWSKFNSGDLRAALTDVRKSLELNPQYENAIDTRNKVLEGICTASFNNLEDNVQAISSAQLSMDENAALKKNDLVAQQKKIVDDFYLALGIFDNMIWDNVVVVQANAFGGKYVEGSSRFANNAKNQALESCTKFLDDTQRRQLDFFLPSYTS